MKHHTNSSYNNNQNYNQSHGHNFQFHNNYTNMIKNSADASAINNQRGAGYINQNLNRTNPNTIQQTAYYNPTTFQTKLSNNTPILPAYNNHYNPNHQLIFQQNQSNYAQNNNKHYILNQTHSNSYNNNLNQRYKQNAYKSQAQMSMINPNTKASIDLPRKVSVDSLLSVDESKNDLSNESIELKEDREFTNEEDEEVFEKSIENNNLKSSVSDLCILTTETSCSPSISNQSSLPSPQSTKLTDLIKEENSIYDKSEYFKNLVVAIDQLYPEVKWPLHNTWTFGYIKNTPNVNWAENIKQIADVSYVEDFWSVVTKLYSPSMMTSIGDLTFLKKV